MRIPSKCPCEDCLHPLCERHACEKWETWFAKCWNTAARKIRDYFWQKRDDLGKQRHPRYFYYALPHEQCNPCDKCICAAWCNTPCSLRLHWWDVSMARLRRQLLEEKKPEE